jgi:DNA-binding HxlR family transcriptional regulator
MFTQTVRELEKTALRKIFLWFLKVEYKLTERKIARNILRSLDQWGVEIIRINLRGMFDLVINYQ